MQDSGLLFEDEDLDGGGGGEPSTLAQLAYGGVLETSRALGVDGYSSEQLSRSGFFTILNLGPGVAKPQRSYHLSQLNEVIAAAEKMRLPDFYVGNALYASKRSRQISNVKSLQVAWVDLDCYNEGIDPTPEFVEKLIARARFAGIPAPSHVVSSGRGLYLKWLLDKPVPDSLLPAWNQVQRALSQLYVDLGADIKATDAARVLRVVNTMNGKVIAEQRRAGSGLVGVVWDGGQRHSFETLWQTVNLLDLETTKAIKKAGAKVAHLAGRNRLVPDFILPPGARGDLGLLEEFGTTRLPRLDLEAKARAEGKGNGFSGVSLAWNRFLDLRDLMHRRAEATGGTGVQEGSRDLTMLWMVNFLAQARVVNSKNVYREIDGLMRAFDGADLPGPRGFEHPEKSGSLDTLVSRIKASEAGHKVRHAGGLWDPKYTPSNDYLINVFGITGDEMRDMRTLIDQNEKRARADRQVVGRAERRAVRHSWNDQALRLRDERVAALKGGDTSVPEQKLCAWIAHELKLGTDQVRKFFKRHDDKVRLAEARKRGEAPARAYRKAAELTPDELEARNRLNAKRKQARFLKGLRGNGYTGDGSAEDVQAWLDAKTEAFKQDNERATAAAVDQALQTQAEGRRGMNAVLERLLRKTGDRAGATDAPDVLPPAWPACVADTIGGGMASGGDRQEEGADSILTSESERVAKTLFRSISQMRDNPANQAPTMNPLPSEQPSPDEPASVSIVGAGKKASKRSLLNKARKAQNKDPLLVSANDPVIEPASTTPTAPLEAASSTPQDVARIATGVIPPDLIESWGEPSPDDSEQAGMPDLDDGYLDSFTEAEAPGASSPRVTKAEQPSDEAGGPAASVSSVSSAAVFASARPAPVLAFARGANARAPIAPGVGRGFGFNRPTSLGKARTSPVPASVDPAASGEVGFAPVRRAVSAPTQPLGFGGPPRLSPDQARANGQHQDFAKLFEEPRYEANGIPVTYPKADVWPHEDLPAGSRYTREEWAKAREPDAELPTGHVVVELQVGNPITSALIKVPRKAPAVGGPALVARTRVVDGKVVKAEPWKGIDDAMADAIADTIVVSRKSPLAAEVRGAVEGGLEIVRGGVSTYFRFIRPKSHFTDPDKFIYINSKLQMTGSLGDVGARAATPVEGTPPADAVEQVELETAEAPRG
ncbi:hypothetical protein LJR175_008392 [Variovorax sp. LjRoot175]|uniref:hypothetical protein n=1 Tax=Variovorax sp. LjRoot175 TaxID=3342276 RepID=UPI003ECE6F1C